MVLVGLGVQLGACRPLPSAEAEDGSSQGSAVGSTSTSSDEDDTRETQATSSMESHGTAQTEDPSSGDDSFHSFTPDAEVSEHCFVFDQDCPDGEKCAPVRLPGTDTYEAGRCVAVVESPDAMGEECDNYEQDSSPIDSCDQETRCLTFAFEPGRGRCQPMCQGLAHAAECVGPFQGCRVTAEGDEPLLCYTPCDPLLQDCPELAGENWSCLFYGAGGNLGWYCEPPGGSTNAEGEPCQREGDCEIGLFCAYSDTGQECEGDQGCCVRYCEVWGETDQCPPGRECVNAFWDESFETFPGLCLAPEDP